jgi:ankyrin repeat protein
MLRPCLPSSVSGILAELPETLDATYERILQEIPKQNRAHAHRLLQCLTAAVRPLAVEELAEVLAIDFDVAGGIPKLNRDLRLADQEQAVHSACSSLIAIVKYKGSRRVQFSHFSVKEFLTSDRLATSELNPLRYHHIHTDSAHTIMAQVCLGVLLRLDDSMDKKTIWSYPLAKYAGEFFHKHAEVGDVLSRISDGVDNLFDPDKPHFKTLIWLGNGCVDIGADKFDFDIDRDSDSDDSSSEQSNSERPFPNVPRIPPLSYTVMSGYSCLIRHLILKGAHDLDATDMHGRTALHFAALSAGFEATRMLIEHAADVNARDKRGYTPLHYAMVSDEEDEDDHFRGLRLLLERGAEAEAQSNRGTTPLHLAASKMSPKIVQILTENATNINIRNEQDQTALHKASLRGNTDIIDIMLNHGADVDAQDNSGSTPLHLTSSEPAAEVLLKHGANVDLQNNKRQTALHIASQHGRFDIVRHLLKNGANVDAQDNDGSTPLHLAISKVSMDSKASLLSEVSESSDEFDLSEAIQYLDLSDGSETSDDSSELDLTALHLPSEHGCLDIIRLLLENGANVDAQDNDGSTPLHLIISNMSMGSKESLHSKASLHPEVSEDSEPHREAVKLLLKHGASGQRENNRGETPFQVAAARGLQEISGLLSVNIQSEQTA